MKVGVSQLLPSDQRVAKLVSDPTLPGELRRATQRRIWTSLECGSFAKFSHGIN
jgi:hypothetical protein